MLFIGIVLVIDYYAWQDQTKETVETILSLMKKLQLGSEAFGEIESFDVEEYQKESTISVFEWTYTSYRFVKLKYLLA